MSRCSKRGEGRVTRKPGSNKLYVDFSYLGVRIEKSLGHDDTEGNREEARKWLDRRMEEIRNGTFRFEKAFPSASDKEKKRFALLEGREHELGPERVVFGEYLKTWMETKLTLLPHTTQIDYLSSINPWIRPHFENFTFFQLNSTEGSKFLAKLVHPQTEAQKAAGEPAKLFSDKRVANIVSHFRTIWDDACNCFRWELPSPFPRDEKKDVKRGGQELVAKDIKVIHVTEKELVPAEEHLLTADRLPLRFDEWSEIYNGFGEWYKPMADLMLLTGMIPSEIAGLCNGLITTDFILVRKKISRGRLYPYLKEDTRRRDIPITSRIRGVLEIFQNRKMDSPFLITTRSGGPMSHTNFGRAWTRALKSAGITHRVPYSLRHSFAAWALCVGTDHNRLVRLMGHATKQMIFENYGKYVQGLEKDRARMREFFGEDF